VLEVAAEAHVTGAPAVGGLRALERDVRAAAAAAAGAAASTLILGSIVLERLVQCSLESACSTLARYRRGVCGRRGVYISECGCLDGCPAQVLHRVAWVLAHRWRGWIPHGGAGLRLPASGVWVAVVRWDGIVALARYICLLAAVRLWAGRPLSPRSLDPRR